MSRMFASGQRFFSTTQTVFAIDEVKKFSGKTLLLLLWVSSEVQRRSSNKLHMTNQQIADAIKCNLKNVPSIRKPLENTELLKVEKGVYSLMNPLEGIPIDVAVPTTAPDPAHFANGWEEAGWVPDDVEV